jgi:methyl-accepting chemotaxis protein
MSLSHLLRGFTIRTRMIGAIAIVLSLLLLLAGAGYAGMNAVRGASETYLVNSSVRLLKLSQLRFAVGQLGHSNDRLIDARQRLELLDEPLKEWDEAKSAADRLSGDLRNASAAVASQRALVSDLMDALKQHEAVFGPVIAKLKANDPAVGSGLTEARDQAQAALTLAEARVLKLEQAFEQEAKSAGAQFDDKVRLTLIAFGVLTLLAAVIVVPTTLINMQSICKPLEVACQLANEVAAGNLTRRIDVSGRDEVADLQRSLLGMQTSLSRLVGSIRQGTESINTASVEIATGNQDLSGRTEQTASALQQTASSMEQLTGGVRQTAESASTANQLVTSATQAAQRGGDVVSQVVVNMGDISESSRKIAEIIGVIDGIAFQTNILALNAAVEAARAGEQGRGFAVVAGEVRGLAQRSANAAREIKSLISASVEKVESGTKLVQDAGASMQEIVTGVARVSDIIAEISAAAMGQSTELGQVNQSVAQLDQMTQQNAALVEQSAAAAESMREQAGRLAQAVEVFRVAA